MSNIDKAMSDISREKLEAWLDANTKTKLTSNVFGVTRTRTFPAPSKIKKALRSGELDADPWIPVSTPPEEAQIVRIKLANGDKVKAKYYDKDWHVGNWDVWIMTENKNRPGRNVVLWQPIEEDDNE